MNSAETPHLNTPSSSAVVVFVTALYCEAEPLIKVFGMSPCPGAGRYRLFANQDGTTRLVLSGVGSLHAAMSVGFVSGLMDGRLASDLILINVGIAGAPPGHGASADQHSALGKLYLADKVVDELTNECCYPSVTLFDALGLESKQLKTVGAPQDPSTHEHGMIDMESYGFFKAAMRATSRDFIFIIKVISDHSLADWPSLTKEHVSSLIEASTSKIRDLVTHIRRHHAILWPGPSSALESSLDVMTKKLRFSVYQSHQLRESVRRLLIWHPEDAARLLLEDITATSKTAGICLSRLSEHLEKGPYTWPR